MNYSQFLNMIPEATLVLALVIVFFADFALRMTAYPTVMYSPYYYGSYNAKDKDGFDLAVLDPLERIDRKVFDAVLTLGWRF